MAPGPPSLYLARPIDHARPPAAAGDPPRAPDDEPNGCEPCHGTPGSFRTPRARAARSSPGLHVSQLPASQLPVRAPGVLGAPSAPPNAPAGNDRQADRHDAAACTTATSLRLLGRSMIDGALTATGPVGMRGTGGGDARSACCAQLLSGRRGARGRARAGRRAGRLQNWVAKPSPGLGLVGGGPGDEGEGARAISCMPVVCALSSPLSFHSRLLFNHEPNEHAV